MIGHLADLGAAEREQLGSLSGDVHWDDVLRWFQTRITNGVLKAIKSLVQAAWRRARGYRTDKHYIAMIYMTPGKLIFGLTT